MEYKDNFRMPYFSQLQDKVEPGQTLIIKGIVHQEAESFSINLSCGSGASGNAVPLHLSVRFEPDEILVFNHYDGSSWGEEIRKKNPFKRGEPVDLRIRAHGDHFEILVDQKEFLDFKHRMPLSSISHMFIDGNFSLSNVHWGGRYYPIPYEGSIGGGLSPGRRLYISGTPKRSAQRFHVELVHQNGNVAFHFNPRFDEEQVVRNTKEGDGWQNEEREGTFPFKPEQGFDLIIANEQYAIQVYVDGERHCSFAHRMEPNGIVGLRCNGDFELTGIHSA